MINFVFSTLDYGPFSILIRRRTNSWASHVDTVLPDNDNVLGALFVRGVVERPLVKVVEKASMLGLAAVHVNDDERLTKFWSFMQEQRGKGYDYKGVLGIQLDGRRWQSSERWFCSELPAAGLHSIDLYVAQENACLITPRDMWVSLRVAQYGRFALDRALRKQLMHIADNEGLPGLKEWWRHNQLQAIHDQV